VNQNRFAMPAAVVAGIFFMCVAPGPIRAQFSQPGQVQGPPTALPGVGRPTRDAHPTDYFYGLKFTPEQKAQIDEIHQNMKSRMDTVAKSQQMSPEQKDAMLAGLERMKQGQIFKLLTPEQQKEVRERIRARRAAEKEEKKQSAAK
jgi:Spy/CpxP family protein refolding chaperone